ncbi:hypothetical protein F4775DRAFT_120605 [Biscogniauxia sp. FL1348]|nr:hypothetical protein F4775DRAFT_120605 [Biscogniauxia sp. FL1348]
MHVKPKLAPAKPQLHSRKHHHIYNGVGRLPRNCWVRSPTLCNTAYEDYALVYEIILYFDHNRACTIYRSWEDFERLRKTMAPWKGAVRYEDRNDVQGMHRLLREALSKRPRDCALEYFLRRRMEDCGGCC